MDRRHVYVSLFAVAYALFVFHAARMAASTYRAARYREARSVKDWLLFWLAFTVAVGTAPLWSAPFLLLLPSWWARRWWRQRRRQ